SDVCSSDLEILHKQPELLNDFGVDREPLARRLFIDQRPRHAATTMRVWLAFEEHRNHSTARRKYVRRLKHTLSGLGKFA
uniref:hypothetical protein n=1 Tax=Hyphomonas atlantica TaxID=1280948 RepID=UPI00355A9A1D